MHGILWVVIKWLDVEHMGWWKEEGSNGSSAGLAVSTSACWRPVATSRPTCTLADTSSAANADLAKLVWPLPCCVLESWQASR